MWKILDQAEPLQVELREFVEKDAQAFQSLLEATRMPKEKPEDLLRRTEAINSATLHAAEIPLEVCKKTIQIMELALQAVRFGNLNAISDAASGFAMAQAALRGAGWNVQINLVSMTNSAAAQVMLSELQSIKSSATHLDGELTKALEERGGIS